MCMNFIMTGCALVIWEMYPCRQDQDIPAGIPMEPPEFIGPLMQFLDVFLFLCADGRSDDPHKSLYENGACA
jgi:hypothetical protein